MSGDLRDAYSNVLNISWSGLILYLFADVRVPAAATRAELAAAWPQARLLNQALMDCIPFVSLSLQWSGAPSPDRAVLQQQSAALQSSLPGEGVTQPAQEPQNTCHCQEARTRLPSAMAVAKSSLWRCCGKQGSQCLQLWAREHEAICWCRSPGLGWLSLAAPRAACQPAETSLLPQLSC